MQTIQRDTDSLCEVRIPVVAKTGSAGGYYLPDSYRMDAQTATEEDYSYIFTALKRYSTAMDNPRINAAIEKISTLTSNI